MGVGENRAGKIFQSSQFSEGATPRLLFVGGAMRSGSTLLGALIDRMPHYFNVGEVLWFWSDVVKEKRRCSCGELIKHCPFWSPILQDVRDAGVNVKRMASFARQFDRTRGLGLLWTRSFNRKLQNEWREYLAGTELLYCLIQKRIGNRVMVDVSKVPTHFSLLTNFSSIDLRILHLVRDGRAVSYSWDKRRRLRKKAGIAPNSNTRSALKAMLYWVVQDILLRRMFKKYRSYSLLKYEDLVKNPEANIEAALAELDLPREWSLSQEQGGFKHETHSLAGSNKVRVAGSNQVVRIDDEWRRKLSFASKVVLSTIGAPSLRSYGYSVLSLGKGEVREKISQS